MITANAWEEKDGTIKVRHTGVDRGGFVVLGFRV
jgi:hypothetical protein